MAAAMVLAGNPAWRQPLSSRSDLTADPSASQLATMFPDTDAWLLEVVLDLCEGNMERAVEMLLGEGGTDPSDVAESFQAEMEREAIKDRRTTPQAASFKQQRRHQADATVAATATVISAVSASAAKTRRLLHNMHRRESVKARISGSDSTRLLVDTDTETPAEEIGEWPVQSPVYTPPVRNPVASPSASCTAPTSEDRYASRVHRAKAANRMMRAATTAARDGQ